MTDRQLDMSGAQFFGLYVVKYHPNVGLISKTSIGGWYYIPGGSPTVIFSLLKSKYGLFEGFKDKKAPIQLHFY